MIDAAAVLWSSSETDRVGRPLIVLLHGYGSHEGDLFQLAPYLPLEPVVASLRAPITIGSGSYSWFPLELPLDPENVFVRASDVDDAARGVLAWLDAEAGGAPVTLIGFSQGAATAVQALRLAPERFASVVALSGFVAPDADSTSAADARLAETRPRVFWGRGTHDSVIPPRAIEHAAAWLHAHTDLDERIYEGVAHGVSQPELSDVAAFVAASFGRTEPTA